MAATTSKDFGLRFFCFAFACLLYSIWGSAVSSGYTVDHLRNSAI